MAIMISKQLRKARQHEKSIVMPTLSISGGFLFLLFETRFEHRAVLTGDWQPWIPIIMSGAMVLLLPLAGVFCAGGGKRMLTIVYSLTVALGVLGVYFHSEGHFFERLAELVKVWLVNVEDGAKIASPHPPLLAPLAFVGLGLLGLFSIFDTFKCNCQHDHDSITAPANAQVIAKP